MKKILSLFALLMMIVVGAKANYKPTADEVIILNEVYDESKSDAGYSTHSAIYWNGTASTNSKKAGDPYNGGASTSSNVPCYSVKNNGGGKNIDLVIEGCSGLVVYHESHSSRYLELLEGSTQIAKGSVSTFYTEVELDATKSYTLRMHGTTGSDNQDLNIYAVKLIPGSPAPTGGPTIDVEPQDAEFVMGTTNYPSLSVEATATEGNIEYQWYYKGATDIAIPGASSATLSLEDYISIPVVAAMMQTPGEYGFYCTLTDGSGSKDTRTAKVTVRAASTACELISVQFSNTAYGSITDPQPEKQDDPSTDEDESAPAQDGKVVVPYMNGYSVPSIEQASVELSEGATWSVSNDETQILVTAEDGVTTATYNITAQAITAFGPTEDVTEDFTEVPFWVYNPYGYDADKGLKFAKAVNDAGNMRISKGNTRQYYFIGAAKTFALTKKGTTRKVNVYLNGEKIKSNVDNDAIGTIELDATTINMVVIESNQTSGDGGFAGYTIEAATAELPTATINSEGFATFSCEKHVEIAPGTAGVKVYYANNVKDGKLYLAELGDGMIPAETGVIIAVDPNAGIDEVQFVEIDDPQLEIDNLLYPTTTANGLVPVPENPTDGSPDALTLDGKVFKTFTGATFNANKAFLVKHEIVDAMAGNTLEIVFEGEATAITDVNANENADAVAPAKVIKNGQLFIGNFNVAGQRVQ